MAVELIPVLELGYDAIDVPMQRLWKQVGSRSVWVSDYWSLWHRELPEREHRTIYVPVDTALGYCGIDALRDAVHPLPGGFLLRVDNRTIAKPGCCSDVGCIGHWKKAAAWQSSSWHHLWNGHPSVAVRQRGRNLQISRPFDVNQKPRGVAVSVSTIQLTAAVREAARKIAGLRSDLRALKGMGTGRSREKLVDRMTVNEEANGNRD